jgi:hypothetical protein
MLECQFFQDVGNAVNLEVAAIAAADTMEITGLGQTATF